MSIEYGVPTEHIPSPMTISCVHSPQQLSQHRASGTPSVDEPFSRRISEGLSVIACARVFPVSFPRHSQLHRLKSLYARSTYDPTTRAIPLLREKKLFVGKRCTDRTRFNDDLFFQRACSTLAHLLWLILLVSDETFLVRSISDQHTSSHARRWLASSC